MLIPDHLRSDSLISAVTKIGTAMDQRTSYQFCRGHVLTPEECRDLYTFNDLAGMVCDIVPEEALTEPWLFTADSDERLQKTLQRRSDELELLPKFLDAAVFGRVYGDTFLYMVVDDGTSEERQPMGLVRKIRFLRKIERDRITPMTYYSDPREEKHGQPETYMISFDRAASVEVHESRLLRFTGARTAQREMVMNNWFNHSILQRVSEVLRDFGITWAAASRLVTQSIQGKYKLQNLAKLLAAPGQTGREQLSKRVGLIDEVRGMFNSLILDAESEDFTYEVASFTSLPELLDRFANRFAAASGGIPVTKLFGVSPAGMNATGESDAKNWLRILNAYRRDHLTPPLRRLLTVLLQEQGKQPDAAEVSWPSLTQPTSAEEAAERLSIAQSDAAYIDAQVVTPEQVARARFVRPDGFKHEIQLTEADVTANIEAHAETQAENAQADSDPVDTGGAGSEAAGPRDRNGG